MARFGSKYVGAENIGTLLDFEEKVKVRLRQVIQTQAAQVLSRAKVAASGAVLKPHKGRILNSIQMESYESDKGFGARVFSDWYIGRFWETGFGKGKAFAVKAHTRHVKAQDTFRIEQGKTLKTRSRLRYVKSGQGVAFVKAHTRKIDQKPRSFLRSSLEPLRSQIRAALAAAVKG
jgi:predicted PhzF superfamily epimerase YddE/YHI9